MPVPRGAVVTSVAPLVALILLAAGALDRGVPTVSSSRAGSTVGAASGPSERPSAAPGEVRPAVRALGILRRWDRSRAAAYASGDACALRRLYSPASWAGARDVRTLRQYAERAIVVRRLRMQVQSARLLPSAPGVVRLRVVERLARGTVVSGASQVSLPRGRPTGRMISLVRSEGEWVVRSVRRR